MIRFLHRLKSLTLVSVAGAALVVTLPVLAQTNTETGDSPSSVSPTETQPETAPEARPDPSQPVTEEAQPEVLPEASATPSQPVTDAELQQLVNVVPELQAIQESAQSEVMTAVEASGLSPERLNQIAEAQSAPEAGAGVEVTAEEQAAFDAVFSEIERIEQEFLTQREQLLQAEGLTVERYQEIMAALQQDPALQQQVEELL